MNKFKRTLRRFAFILLIILAAVGVGIVGGIPIPSNGRKKETAEIVTEQVDDEATEKLSNQQSITKK